MRVVIIVGEGVDGKDLDLQAVYFWNRAAALAKSLGALEPIVLVNKRLHDYKQTLRGDNEEEKDQMPKEATVQSFSSVGGAQSVLDGYRQHQLIFVLSHGFVDVNFKLELGTVEKVTGYARIIGQDTSGDLKAIAFKNLGSVRGCYLGLHCHARDFADFLPAERMAGFYLTGYQPESYVTIQDFVESKACVDAILKLAKAFQDLDDADEKGWNNACVAASNALDQVRDAAAGTKKLPNSGVTNGIAKWKKPSVITYNDFTVDNIDEELSVCAFCEANYAIMLQTCTACTVAYAHCGCEYDVCTTCASKKKVTPTTSCSSKKDDHCCGCGKSTGKMEEDAVGECKNCKGPRCVACSGSCGSAKPEEAFIRFCTWNAEKYGGSTVNKNAKEKSVLRILNDFHPDVLVLQEVTDANLFHKNVNVNDLEYALEYENPDKKDLKVNSEFESKLGPYYVGGGSYREYYPLYFNRARVVGTPALHVFSVTDKNPTLDNPSTDGKQFNFKASKNSPRLTPFWRVRLQAGLVLRKGKKGPRAGQRIVEVLVAVVHTSPTLRKTTTKGFKTSAKRITTAQQSKDIVELARRLLKSTGLPIVIAGDFYADKKKSKNAKSYLEELANDNDFVPILPPTLTNFPGKGKGQVADHFIVSKAHWSLSDQKFAWTIMPPEFDEEDEEDEDNNNNNTSKQKSKLKSTSTSSSSESFGSTFASLPFSETEVDDESDKDFVMEDEEEEDTEESEDFEDEDMFTYDKDVNTEENLREAWRDIDVDHCPVFAMLRLDVKQALLTRSNATNNNNNQNVSSLTKRKKDNEESDEEEELRQKKKN